MAAASAHVMNLEKAVYDQHTSPMQSHINVGCGKDVSIADLAHAIAQVTALQGAIYFDQTKPDGSPRKLMDGTRINHLGWLARLELTAGLQLAYQDFVKIHA